MKYLNDCIQQPLTHCQILVIPVAMGMLLHLDVCAILIWHVSHINKCDLLKDELALVADSMVIYSISDNTANKSHVISFKLIA